MFKLNWKEKRPYPPGLRGIPAFKDYRELKAKVLESFLFEWHDAIYFSEFTPTEFVLYPSDLSRVSMRLLRYHRQGLLARRRRCHRFEYTLTMKGKLRLVYLWRKLGKLKIPPWDGEDPESYRLGVDAAKATMELAVIIKKEAIRESKEELDRLLLKRLDELCS